MTRKAIMLGSPGPKNSATYLKGVDTDLHHFVSFLKSPVGGSWEDEEIAGFYNGPSEYLIELIQSTNTDFCWCISLVMVIKTLMKRILQSTTPNQFLFLSSFL